MKPVYEGVVAEGRRWINRFGGFSVDADPGLIAEPGSLPPAKGHSMVPRPRFEEVLAERDAALANAITSQQRAVLERVDYIRVVMLSEQRRTAEGQRDLWVAEMLTAASAAVDALPEAER